MHGRGFESAEQSQAAAREFVRFCGDRMWVLSEAGTTADGEKVYAFTHRTFMEYFAAAHLATVSDTPEDLAQALAPHVRTVKGWTLVGELAVQIKDRTSDRGADRIYTALLDPALVNGDRGPLLLFLAGCLDSARPSPAVLRSLTQSMLSYRLAQDTPLAGRHPLCLMLGRGGSHREVIADEISKHVAIMVMSGDSEKRAEGLLLSLEVGQEDASAFWAQWSAEQASLYAAEITAEAAHSVRLRAPALDAHVITLQQALEMPGGFSALMEIHPQLLLQFPFDPYPVSLCFDLIYQSEDRASRSRASGDAIRNLALIGHYLADNPDLPWARTVAIHDRTVATLGFAGISDRLDHFSGLAVAAVHAMYAEITGLRSMEPRAGITSLTALPMPGEFKKLFQDWEELRVNFVEIIGK